MLLYSLFILCFIKMFLHGPQRITLQVYKYTSNPFVTMAEIIPEGTDLTIPETKVKVNCIGIGFVFCFYPAFCGCRKFCYTVDGPQ